MSSFKSWLVANIEVILIIFTVVFLIITSLIMIPKAVNEENDAITSGYVVILMSSIFLCAMFVYAIRNGFMAFLALALFLGFVTTKAWNATKEEVQKAETEVVSQVQDGKNNSNTDFDRFLLEKGGGNLSGFGYFGFVSLQQSSVCSLQYMQTSILTTWFLGVFFTEIVTLTCSQSNGSTHSIGFTQDLSLCSR